MLWILGAIVSVLLTTSLLVNNKIKQVGKDPAIVTIQSIVSYSFKIVPLVVVFTTCVFLFVTGFIYMGIFIAVFMGFAYFVHIIALVVFSRTPTQPTMSYACVCVAWLCLSLYAVWPQAILVIAGAFMIFAWRTYLYWDKHKTKIYHKWVFSRIKRLDTKYNTLLSTMPSALHYWVLVILITEDIARPKASRFIERTYYYFAKPKLISSGIMQVSAKRLLSNEESIVKGSELIKVILSNAPQKSTEQEFLRRLAKEYNGSYSYASLLTSMMPSIKKYARQSGLLGEF